MMVRITLTKSTIGAKRNQRATIKALGLNKIGKSVQKDNTEMISGMLKVVGHLVDVAEISE